MKRRTPVIGRLSVSLGVVFWWLPDIPVTVRVVFGAPGLLEPLVLVARVIDDEVEDELHAPRVKLVFQDVNIFNASISWINYFVVANVIPLDKS